MKRVRTRIRNRGTSPGGGNVTYLTEHLKSNVTYLTLFNIFFLLLVRLLLMPFRPWHFAKQFCNFFRHRCKFVLLVSSSPRCMLSVKTHTPQNAKYKFMNINCEIWIHLTFGGKKEKCGCLLACLLLAAPAHLLLFIRYQSFSWAIIYQKKTFMRCEIPTALHDLAHTPVSSVGFKLQRGSRRKMFCVPKREHVWCDLDVISTNFPTTPCRRSWEVNEEKNETRMMNFSWSLYLL